MSGYLLLTPLRICTSTASIGRWNLPGRKNSNYGGEKEVERSKKRLLKLWSKTRKIMLKYVYLTMFFFELYLK